MVDDVLPSSSPAPAPPAPEVAPTTLERPSSVASSTRMLVRPPRSQQRASPTAARRAGPAVSLREVSPAPSVLEQDPPLPIASTSRLPASELDPSAPEAASRQLPRSRPVLDLSNGVAPLEPGPAVLDQAQSTEAVVHAVDAAGSGAKELEAHLDGIPQQSRPLSYGFDTHVFNTYLEDSQPPIHHTTTPVKSLVHPTLGTTISPSASIAQSTPPPTPPPTYPIPPVPVPLFSEKPRASSRSPRVSPTVSQGPPPSDSARMLHKSPAHSPSMVSETRSEGSQGGESRRESTATERGPRRSIGLGLGLEEPRRRTSSAAARSQYSGSSDRRSENGSRVPFVFAADYQPVHSPTAPPALTLDDPDAKIPFPERRSPSLASRPLVSPQMIATTSLSPITFADATAPSWLDRPHDMSKPEPIVSVAPLLSPTETGGYPASADLDRTPRGIPTPLSARSDVRPSSRTSSRGVVEGSEDWIASTGSYYTTESHEHLLVSADENSPRRRRPSYPHESSGDDLAVPARSRRESQKSSPPALRAKSTRRGYVAPSSPTPQKSTAVMEEDANSATDGGPYSSTDESSLGGGYSDVDGAGLPAQLSASDFVDAYGAFSSSPSPSDLELALSHSNSTDYVQFADPPAVRMRTTLEPPPMLREASGQRDYDVTPSSKSFIEVPSPRRAHSRTSSNDIMDELDAQIEEAMANFAHHGITPASPTGPPPVVVTRAVTEMIEGYQEADRRPSLGQSSQSEDDVYHEAYSARDFSPDWSKDSPRSLQRPMGIVEDEAARPFSFGLYDEQEEHRRSILLLVDENVYDGDEGSPSVGFHDAPETDTEDEDSLPAAPGELAAGRARPNEMKPAAASLKSRADAKGRAAAFVADLRRARAMAAAEAVDDAAAIASFPNSRRQSADSHASRRGSSGGISRTLNGALSVESLRSTSDQGGRTLHNRSSTQSLADTLVIAGSHPMSGTKTITPSIASERPRYGTKTSYGSVSSLPSPSSSSLPLPSDRTHDRAAWQQLTRIRTLPPSAHYADIAKNKTAAGRALMYAHKINGLAAEESGLSTWIAATRGGQSPRSGDSSSQSVKSHHQRYDPSSASSIAFPMRQQDTFRAKEIPRGSFTPADMIPAVPYPGVLQSSRFSSMPRESKGGPRTASGFFSLGRKSSKRTPPATSGHRSVLGVNIGIVGGGNLVVNSGGAVASPASLLVGPRMPGRGSVDGGPALTPPPVDQENLADLQSILPHARPEDLARFLHESSNDVARAIALWVAAEAAR